MYIYKNIDNNNKSICGRQMIFSTDPLLYKRLCMLTMSANARIDKN